MTDFDTFEREVARRMHRALVLSCALRSLAGTIISSTALGFVYWRAIPGGPHGVSVGILFGVFLGIPVGVLAGIGSALAASRKPAAATESGTHAAKPSSASATLWVLAFIIAFGPLACGAARYLFK